MTPYQPGDYILNRYMPNASVEEREAARERLKRLARWLIRVHSSQTNPQDAIRASGGPALESDSSANV